MTTWERLVGGRNEYLVIADDADELLVHGRYVPRCRQRIAFRILNHQLVYGQLRWRGRLREFQAVRDSRKNWRRIVNNCFCFICCRISC